jgi:cytochrome c oxidase subunit 2
MVLARLGAFWATLAATALAPAAAFADQPHEWEWSFQEPATPVMEEVVQLHDKLLWIIVIISVFVLGLLVVVIVRFNEKRNPTPSRTTHNAVLEVAWTVIPVLILLFIAFGPPISSFRLLYFADRTADAKMTIKAVGHQWYWAYEYPDQGNFTFDACMKTPTDKSYIPACDSADEAPGDLRLLETVNRVIVPVDTNIRLLTTAEDVLHSWAMPSFGVKLDAVPGRNNETWFRVERPGVYYGQCSELCGLGHAYMPIVVEAVPMDKFEAWVAEAKAKFPAVGGTPPANIYAQNAAGN